MKTIITLNNEGTEEERFEIHESIWDLIRQQIKLAGNLSKSFDNENNDNGGK